MMSKRQKKGCTTLNCIEHLLNLDFEVAGYVLISAFASLVGISIGVTSSTVGLKMCDITAGIKKYKSIIKKKKKNEKKISISIIS